MKRSLLGMKIEGMMKNEMKVGIQTDVICFGGVGQMVHNGYTPQLQERTHMQMHFPTDTIRVCID